MDPQFASNLSRLGQVKINDAGKFFSPVSPQPTYGISSLLWLGRALTPYSQHPLNVHSMPEPRSSHQHQPPHPQII